jgi:hypothetical protein
VRVGKRRTRDGRIHTKEDKRGAQAKASMKPEQEGVYKSTRRCKVPISELSRSWSSVFTSLTSSFTSLTSSIDSFFGALIAVPCDRAGVGGGGRGLRCHFKC